MSHSSGRPAWPSNDDFLFFSLAIIVLGTAFFGWFFWTFHHTEMAAAAVQVIHLQALLLSNFGGQFDHADSQLLAQPPSTFTIGQLVRAFTAIGSLMRPYVIPPIVVLGILCFLGAAPSRYTTVLNLEGLIREQVRTFRYNAAYVSRPLKLVKLEAGQLRPSDPALHAHEWVARFAANEDGSFKESAARQALAAQLGTPWRGVGTAQPIERLMLAVSALHLTQKRDEARVILGELSASLPRGDRKEGAGADTFLAVPYNLVQRADAILKEAPIAAEIRRIGARHAHTVPVLMSVLTEGRVKAGVLAPGQFACLKLISRSLWYALHSLGFEGDGPGQTSHPNPRAEAAGVRDHWQMERLVGRPIISPSVDRAVAAIRASLGETGASPGKSSASEAA